MSRGKPALALLGLALAFAACGPASHHASGPEAPSRARTTTTRPPPSTTSSTASASLGYLTGYGATQAVWDQSHTANPEGTGFYPILGNGLDTYTNVEFTNGRALSYTLNLYPAAPVDQALSSVGDEMPFDAKVIYNQPSPATNPVCQQVVETSPTLQAAAGVDVLAELRSDGPTLDTDAVSEITFQPFTGPLSSLPAC